MLVDKIYCGVENRLLIEIGSQGIVFSARAA